MPKLTPEGYAVILSFEGISLRAYKDVAGVWTIAGGVTNYDKGAVARIGKIGPGLTIDMATALELTHEAIDRYVPPVEAALPGESPRVIDGGTSFHYNTGAIGRASWVPRFKARDMAGAEASIMSWNKAGGKARSGLTRRRAREWAIITRGDYGPEARTAPLLIGANGKPTGERIKVTVGKTGQRANTPAEVSNLTPKMDAADVLDVQRDLKELGYNPGSLDGVFGGQTKAAVRVFQQAHPELTADGIPGRATRAALDRAVDLKRKAGRVAKAGAAATAAAGAATMAGFSKVLPFIIAGAAVAVLVILAIRYREEIKRRINRTLGKAVR